MSQKYIGTRIRAAREARGIKQSELARAVKRSPSIVNQWESGKSAVSIDDLVAVADAVEVPLIWLAAGRGAPTFSQPAVRLSPLSAEELTVRIDRIERAIESIANSLAAKGPAPPI
jgi:transcriptional regulator with XRE-family HTH domain